MAGTTTIPAVTAAQFAARMCALFPPNWSSAQAKQPGGAVYSMLQAIGSGPASETLALGYADAATRLQTAQGQALDIALVDFFGDDDAQLNGLPDYDRARNPAPWTSTYTHCRG